MPSGFKITSRFRRCDTPMPHNGCRAPEKKTSLSRRLPGEIVARNTRSQNAGSAAAKARSCSSRAKNVSPTSARLSARNYPPGQHGQKSDARLSGYGVQLREKQKIAPHLRPARTPVSQGSTSRSGRQFQRRDRRSACCRCWKARLDTVAYRMGFGIIAYRSAPGGASQRRHSGQRPSRQHSVLPVSSPGDVIEVSQKRRKAQLRIKACGRSRRIAWPCPSG